MIVDTHVHMDPPGGERAYHPMPRLAGVLQMMEQHDIAAAVALPGPSALAGTPKMIAAANDGMAAAMRQHPGRLIGFATVNPFHDEAWDELERAARLGLRGLKLHPPLQGLNIADRKLMDPLLQRTAALGWPVIIHAGPTPGGLAYVILNLHDLKVVAQRHPQAIIIVAHMAFGGRDTNGMDALARECPNVWFETSGVGEPGLIKQVADWGALERIVYGSDFPFMQPQVELLKVQMAGLPSGALEKVLAGNACRLLGMEKG